MEEPERHGPPGRYAKGQKDITIDLGEIVWSGLVWLGI
jgi:hypothetical protein